MDYYAMSAVAVSDANVVLPERILTVACSRSNLYSEVSAGSNENNKANQCTHKIEVSGLTLGSRR